MHVNDAETPLLKSWVVKQLDHISDADSDVLADYVLALVKSDEPEDQVRQSSRESLEDFLKDNAPKFVDDVIRAIKTHSYDPNYKPPGPDPASAPSLNPPSGPSAAGTGRSSIPGANSQNGSSNGPSTSSRKRNFNDTGLGNGPGGREFQHGRGDRAVKQMRRGNNRGRGDSQAAGAAWGQQNGQTNQAPAFPTPPGFPPVDPNNPLATMLAMSAMGFPMPGFPNLPASSGFGQSGASQNAPPKKPGKRCRDYDTKGFCALGTSCPYEHGPDSIVVGQHEEYDPTKSPLETSHRGNDFTRGGDRGRGRGRGRGDRSVGFGGKQRAAFSHAGQNYDKSNTTIVVEQIPEDKFDEKVVRDFFSEFGGISEVQMQAYKHLAIVKYEDYQSARAAYDSPKVIFDNRFVKVYWYKPDSVPVPPSNGNGPIQAASESKPDEEMIDPVEFEKKQAEAQQAHEAKRKEMEEAKKAREELEAKMKASTEERKRLMEKLAAKTSGATASPAGAGSPPQNVSTTPAAVSMPSQTEALRAKLAELEAEAARIGLDPSVDDSQYSSGYSSRGRGGYRARGGYPPRGRGYDPAWRGSYRGRGGFGAASRGAVMRLDNRPKKIVVTAPGLREKDEMFRLHVYNNYEVDSVEPLSDKPDAMVVGFKERYMAENFMSSATDIPQIGHTELSWQTAPTSSSSTTSLNANAASFTPGASSSSVTATDGDINMSGGPQEVNTHEEAPKQDVDYDVADDNDRW